MDTIITTARQPADVANAWRIFLTTPGLRGETYTFDNMIDPPTIEIQPDGTMRVGFDPSSPAPFDSDDYDPWLTVVNVTHDPAAGRVVLTTDHAEWGRQIVLMSEEEYHSQV